MSRRLVRYNGCHINPEAGDRTPLVKARSFLLAVGSRAVKIRTQGEQKDDEFR